MNTKVIPKLVQNIDEDNVIIWFKESNKYVITSKIQSDLMALYMNPDNSRDSFVSHLSKDLGLDEASSNALLHDIQHFVNDVTTTTVLQENSGRISSKIPLCEIQYTYVFYGKTITIHFESEIIKSLIHPQIVHHQVEQSSECDVSFTIFKEDNYLVLYKNGDEIGRYETKSFHFLQGRFALELTNSIHNTNINNWIATFHASTITNGKESVMIIGDSGNGKSTLSVLLMAQGYDILCDDFTPLYEDDMHIYRYPAATSIKKGAFDALKPYISNIDSIKTHTSGPKKVNIKYVPPLLRYDELSTNFPCTKIVYVKYDKNSKSSFEPVSLNIVLETLIPDSWISPEEHHASKFMDWLKKVNCYKLNYSSNDFAISQFKKLFEDS